MRKVEDLSSRVEEQKQEAMKEWQEQIRQEEERIAAEVAKVWPNAKARIAEREQVKRQLASVTEEQVNAAVAHEEAKEAQEMDAAKSRAARALESAVEKARVEAIAHTTEAMRQQVL